MTLAVAPVPGRGDEWSQLSLAQQRLLTPEAMQRWTADLHEDDYTLAEVAELERKRRANLQTIRQGTELTDMEWRLWRFLVRHAGPSDHAQDAPVQ